MPEEKRLYLAPPKLCLTQKALLPFHVCYDLYCHFDWMLTEFKNVSYTLRVPGRCHGLESQITTQRIFHVQIDCTPTVFVLLFLNSLQTAIFEYYYIH